VHTAEACSWSTAELYSFFNLGIRRNVKVSNMLPSYIKIDSDNPKKFKLIVQKFLYENSFYSLDEILNFKKVKFIYFN
jgi:hypothetical protein